MEEQCVSPCHRVAIHLNYYRWMTACVKGVNCLYPCPRCLVQNEDQWDLLPKEPSRHRTQEGARQIYTQAKELYDQGRKGAADDLLKKFSYYHVWVRILSYFWSL